MLQNKIVCKNGKTIDSSAILSCEYTESVNSSHNLSVGDTTADSITLEVRGTIDGAVVAGEEVTYYQIEDGAEKKIGIFVVQEPSVTSKTSYRFTAHDRTVKLEKVISEALRDKQADFPMTLLALAEFVCGECGLTLATTDFPMANLSVNAFYADDLTGRQIMSWISAIAGRYCCFNQDGELVLDWFKQRADIAVTPDGANGSYPYYLDSLQYCDYATETIQRVQLNYDAEDIGVIYPSDAVGNMFSITGNMLLSGMDTDTLNSIASHLYNALKGISYTPCSFRIKRTGAIRAGDIISVTNPDGQQISTYVMTASLASDGTSCQSTGDPNYGSAAAVASQAFQNLVGRVMRIKADVDGLKISNEDLTGKVASLELTAEEIKTTVSETKTEVKTYADTQAQAAETAAKGYTDDALVSYSTTTQVRSMIDQKADEISLSVEKTNAQVAQAQATADGAQDAADILSNTVDQEIARLDVKTDGITAQVSETKTQIEQVQETANGKNTTYTGDAVPTVNNYPANAWTTPEERMAHVGDLYFDKDGRCYRYEGFEQLVSGAYLLVDGGCCFYYYQWTLRQDADIAALSTRMTTAESTISQHAGEIAMKVSMAEVNSAVSMIQKTVSAELALKVSKDDNAQIISMINAAADVITLNSNRLVINSTNFTLAADGTITAKNGNFSGTLTAESGLYKAMLTNGILQMYYNDAYIGSFASTYIQGNTDQRGIAMHLTQAASYMLFGRDSDGDGLFEPGYVINYGVNWGGYTERHVFFGSALFTTSIRIANACTLGWKNAAGEDCIMAYMSDSDRLYIGHKDYPTYFWSHDIYRVTANGWAMKVPEIQHGLITITPSAAKTPTGLAVTFPVAFSAVPHVAASPSTLYPATAVLGVSTAGASTTGVTVYLTTTDTAARSAIWIAAN